MRLLSRSVIAFTLAASLTAPVRSAAPAKETAPAAQAIQAINAADLRRHIAFLSSPELGGRYTLSPSLSIAARYIAAELESLGYRGAAANNSFFQDFELLSLKSDDANSSLQLTMNGKLQEFRLGEFVSSSEVAGSAQGDLVFVGYGISAPEAKHDDYAGLDVKGKIVVVGPGTPSGVRVESRQRGMEMARQKGAAGIILLPTAGRAGRMAAANYRERVLAAESVRLVDSVDPEIPSAYVNTAGADLLLAPLGLTLEKLGELSRAGAALKPQPIPGSAAIRIAFHERRDWSRNVVARLDGTDAKLKDEFVLFSAHYDHLKTNAKGEIYPGADDDGSGIASVLTIARAMAANRPRRSVLVMLHTGEELGLLGARYNADVKPVVPLEKIAVNLNIDQVGRSRPAADTKEENQFLTDGNTVYLVGSNRISTQLHALSESTNQESEKLKLDYLYNDPKHPEQIYYRSDHWHYAKHGVPIIFYFTGLHEDYHRPTDTIEKIDFKKLERIARLVFRTGWKIANMDGVLKRDVKPEAAKAAAAN